LLNRKENDAYKGGGEGQHLGRNENRGRRLCLQKKGTDVLGGWTERLEFKRGKAPASFPIVDQAANALRWQKKKKKKSFSPIAGINCEE